MITLYTFNTLIIHFSSSFPFLPLDLPHLPLSSSPSLSSFTAPAAAAAPEPQRRVPHPPAQIETKGHIRLLNTAPFPTCPFMHDHIVVVVVVEVVGAPGGDEAWTGTKNLGLTQ